MGKTTASDNNKAKRLVLLDAHAILHRAYHALPDFSTSKGEPTGALYGLSVMLIKIIEDLKPDYIVACYDVAAPTYRHEAYKLYKAGRKKAEDDLIAQMKSSRKVFEAMNIPIYDKAGFEADDVLGAIADQMKPRKDIDSVIASGDMDTLQLVDDKRVQVYTLKKGIKDTIMYDEEGVKARFGFGPELIPDYKGLRGDPSDNIPGIKGIGDKTASILIGRFGTIENMYAELKSGDKKFLDAGITPRIIQLLRDNAEEAEFSKMLATIRRDVPIDFVLPDKTFMASLDVKKTDALWRELEFRTLGQRLAGMINRGGTGGQNDIAKFDRKVAEFPNEGGRGARTDTVKLGQKVSQIDPVDFEKTSIALWLVDSTKTQPTIEDISNFLPPSTEDVASDVISDTARFEAAKEAIFAELDRRNLRKVYEEIELPLIPVVKAMQNRGIKIDRKILADLAKTYHAEVTRLETRIWKYAGKEFNISSPKQLGDILFDTLAIKIKNARKTAGGARSTKESELEKMRDLHPIVPLIFEYRELTKLLSTYIDAIPPLLDENDRLHAQFIQTGTTTGRMASQEPNLQNIPIKTDLGRAIRGAFISTPPVQNGEKGFKLCAFDYSQIEIRIAAFLSGDEKLIEIFRKGEDVHTSVASLVFKVPHAEVTPAMRRQAKVINFGIMYGMGVLALKQNLGTSREEAQKFLNDYFETFTGLAKYLDQVKAETARRGYTETFFGRRRYFEGIKSHLSFIRAAAERMAINAPIQGTEADVIKIAMARIYDYCQKNKLADTVFPLVQVHDELVYEIREDKVEQVTTEIKKIMESIIEPKDIHGIVLTANASVGNNWGELK